MLLVVVCTLLAVLIGFFVAAASGYMAGLVGSSSSPISGIGTHFCYRDFTCFSDHW